MLLVASFIVLSNLVASELTDITNNVVKVKFPVSTSKLIETVPILNEPPADFITMAKRDGYLAEEHTITTEDGYILTVHRIHCKIGGKKRKTGKPVLAVHGMLLNSDMWILARQYAIGYQLVDAGYDLWFANLRGTKYSLKHVKLNHDEEAYWNYSFEEIGKYDIPACIDYILKFTKRSSLSYVGFSLGATGYFSMQSKCHYKKIGPSILLGPVAFLTHAKSALLRLALTQRSLLQKTFELAGQYKIGGNASATNQIARVLCSSQTLSADPCRSALELFMGFDPEQMRDELIPRIYEHFPDATSIMNVMHFAQHLYKKPFQKFDLGKEGNLREYGSATPDDYDFKLVTSKTYLFAGINDLLSDIKDVKRIEKLLPNVMETYVVPRECWNHYDHIWAIEANELIGKKIIKILSQYDDDDEL